MMAYGTPESLDDVAGYYTHIRHGRPPSVEQLEDLEGRYRAIGGSPLRDITTKQAEGLKDRLGVPVTVGFKHSYPFIADAVASLRDAQIDLAIGLVMAPHYSSMSVGDYARRALNAAVECGWPGELRMVESWHLEPGYISLLARRVVGATDSLALDEREQAVVIFTAHSLPGTIVRSGDPYPQQLEETAAAVAREGSVGSWRVGWQSAGRTKDEWLGPEIGEVIEKVALDGARAVVVCPCGFVADHLEVLYDIDIEAAERARELGLTLVRTASPNTDPEFLDVLSSIAQRALRAAE